MSQFWRCLAHLRWIRVGEGCPACQAEEAARSAIDKGKGGEDAN